MNTQNLAVALFFAPLSSALCTVKLFEAMTGLAPILDSDSILHYWWVAMVAGGAVFLSINIARRWGLFICILGGVAVVGLVDLVDLLRVVPIFRPGVIPPGAWSLQLLVAKLCAGALYGCIFWFLKPFHIVRPRSHTHNRRYDHFGDF